VFILTAIVLSAILLICHESVQDFLRAFFFYVEDSGVWGMLVYALLFAVATVGFFPVFLLTWGAGFIYAKIYGLGTGIVIGTVIIYIGSILGAIGCLYMGRYCLASFIRSKLEEFPRFARMEKVLENSGAKLMLLVRLSPFIPFNLFNYAMGITNVKLKDYLIGLLGMFPGNVLYVYIGTAFESIDELITGEYQGGKMHYGVFMGGLVVTMVVF
jgi:uncharacterized membrane protein YdjX (TVP38/TMEM64 family)